MAETSGSLSSLKHTKDSPDTTQPSNVPPSQMPDEPPPQNPINVRTSQTPNVRTSQTPNVRTSQTPNIRTSQTPNIRTSQTPNVPPSKTPNVPPSQTPNIRTSQTPNDPLPQTPNVQQSQTPNIPQTTIPTFVPSQTPNVQLSKTPNIPRSKPQNDPSPKTPNVSPSKTPNIPPSKTPNAPPSKPPSVQMSKTPNVSPTKPTHFPPAKTSALPSKDTNVQASKTSNVPPSKIPNDPPSKSPNVPVSAPLNVPQTKTPTVPPPKSPNTLPSKAPNVPPTKPTNAPPAKNTTIPPSKSPNIPPPKSTNVQPSKTPDVPQPKTPNVPPPKTPNIPSPKSTHVPPAKNTNTPSPKPPNIPPSKNTNVPPPKPPNTPPPKPPNIPPPKSQNVPPPKSTNVPPPKPPNATENTTLNDRRNNDNIKDGDVLQLKRKPSETSEESAESAESPPMPPPPDGGWGWFVVLGSFIICLICDGLTFCFGVLYAVLLEKFKDSKSKTSLVGSIFFGVPMIMGPVASALTTRFGCRTMTIFGGLLSSVGFILCIFAETIEMLYITFGVVVGVGFSFCYITSVVMVAFYFEKKVALATGLAMCGTGVGTIAFAPLMDFLITEYGLRGFFLIMSGINLHLVVCGMLFRPLTFPKTESRNKELPEESNELPSSGVDPMQPKDADGIIKSTKSPLKGTTDMDKLPMKKKQVSIMVPADPKVKNEDYEVKSRNVVKAVRRMTRPSVITRPSMLHHPDRRGTAVYLGRHSAAGIHLSESRHSQRMKKKMKDKDEPPQGCCSRLCHSLCGGMVNVKVLCHPFFFIFAISRFMLYFWADVPYMYAADHAIHNGVEPPKAAFILSIIGIFNTIGQLVFGYTGDLNINLLNVYSVVTMFTGMAVGVVPVMTTYMQLCILYAFFAFCVSVKLPVTTVLLINHLGVDALTSAYGLLMLIQGIANLLGPPFAGWLSDVSGSYNLSFYCSGGFYVLSGFLLICAYVPELRHFEPEKEFDLQHRNSLSTSL